MSINETKYFKVTLRDIAKLLCKSLPVQDDEFTDAINTTLSTLKTLPTHHKTALKVAYVFSRKVPKEERDDFFQELSCTLLESGKQAPKLQYAIARCDWVNWWKRYKIREHYSLDSVVTDNEGNSTTIGELLVGECEFEHKICSEHNALEVYESLPNDIRYIVNCRLTGERLKRGEREYLERYANKNLHLIAALS